MAHVPPEYAASDLRDLAGRGVAVLVSLRPMPSSFGRQVAAAGMEWFHFPIEDFAVPSDAGAFSSLVEQCVASSKQDGAWLPLKHSRARR